MAAAAASFPGLPCVTFLSQEAGTARRPQGPPEPSRAATPAQRRHAVRTRTRRTARFAPAPPAPAGSCSSTAYGGYEGNTRPEEYLRNHNSQEAAEPRRRKGMCRHSPLIGSFSVREGWDRVVVWTTLGNSKLSLEGLRTCIFFLN